MSYNIKVGDLEPPLRARITDKDNNPIDVSAGSGYTITVRVLNSTGNQIESFTSAQPVPEAGPDPLVAGSNGWVEHLWVAGETDAEGDYRAEFIATTSSRPRTFPGSGYAAFTIEPILAIGPETAINWGHVVAFYPDLDCLDGAVTQPILRYVNECLDEDAFGGIGSPLLQLARTYLAAHFGTLATVAGESGPVVSEAVGGVSRQFAAGGVGVLWSSRFDATQAGRQYMSLLKTAPGVVGPCVI